MEICTAKVNGFEMDYFSFGTGGKVFVIIPGMSLRSVMLSAPAIAGQYRMFKEDFTVYVFDRRKNPPENYSIRDMAEDTAAVMKLLGIWDAYLFGASQGGMIEQCLAVYFPELVHGMVIASSYCRPNEKSQAIFERWIALAKEHNVPALNHDFFLSIYSDEFLEKNAEALPIVEKQGTAEECENLIIFSKACMNFDFYDSLEKINCPVLVTGATGDKVLTGESSEEMASKIRNCELYMYDSDAHAIYDEAPDYCERLMKFYKSI